MVTALQTHPPGDPWCPCSIVLGFPALLQAACSQYPAVPCAQCSLFAATSKEHPFPSAWVSLLLQGPGQLWGTRACGVLAAPPGFPSLLLWDTRPSLPGIGQGPEAGAGC